MNITKQQIDDLNAVVTVEIAKDDYAPKVDKVLNDYKKNANIPGFRKGHVPMGMVRKQYGKAVLAEEVNKMLQEALGNYINEEKLDVLGNPLPKEQGHFAWDKEDYKFEFELGLAPKFEVNLTPKKAITQYTIVADDKMVNNHVKTLQKQYGKISNLDVAAKDSEVKAEIKSADDAIEKEATIDIASLKGKKNVDAFVGAKVGDEITVKSKGLFSEAQDYTAALGKSEDEAKDLNAELTFTVQEINNRVPAELDQELFDKIFGEGNVKSVTELKEKIKADAESQFKQQSDQQLLNDVTESFIENTKFDLPGAFLTRWIQNSGEERMTEEAAKAEYERSEKGLRYQLIESKLVNDNKLQVTFEELKAYAKEMIKGQMAQFGQTDPDDKTLEDIAARILGNQDEVKRLSEQLMHSKMLDFFKENVKLKTKEVTFENFVKEVYN